MKYGSRRAAQGVSKMARSQKNQEMQDVDHAYANLEHQEWAEDIEKWKSEFQRFSEVLLRTQKWFDHYGTELENHQVALKRHESAVQEHGERTTTGGNVHYIKNVADRRHELYGKGHGDQKSVHEKLRRRHYILVGQLQILAQMLE
jgi:hypothetical protein